VMNGKCQIQHRLKRLESLRLVFSSLVVVPAGFFGLVGLLTPSTDDIPLLMALGSWWPSLLIPLVGFAIVSRRVASLKRELDQLAKREQQGKAT
jgi:hypothetical protein